MSWYARVTEKGERKIKIIKVTCENPDLSFPNAMRWKLCLLFVRKSTKDSLYLPCFASINQLTDVVDMVVCGNIKVNIS